MEGFAWRFFSSSGGRQTFKASLKSLKDIQNSPWKSVYEEAHDAMAPEI